MARNKAQLLRLIFVDRSIRKGMRSGKLANCSSMAEAYEVSYKSIMRDIDYLKHQCDAPIEYDPQRHGFYYTEETYQMPAINISESDLFAICVARKALEQHRNTPVYDKLLRVFGRIEQSLPDRVSIYPSWVDEKITVFGTHHTEINPDIWSTVAEALHRSLRLEVSYLKPGADEEGRREIDPYHVVSFQGEWYLVGFCHLRQEVRTFAISRIKGATAGKTAFTIPADFNFTDFAGSHFGIFRGDRDYKVRIHFSASHAPYVRERQWHPGQKFEVRKDGSLVLSFSTNHLFEVRRWVLSWGEGAKALGPRELIEDIRHDLQNALQAYN